MKKKKFMSLMSLIIMLTVTGCSQPYDFDLAEHLSLGSYSGIEVSLSELEARLEQNTDDLLEQNSTENEITDRPVKNGDIANIDYTGTLNGEVFPGGSATNYDLEIGSGVFVEGFEEGIIGKNIDNIFDVKTVFPEDYVYNQDLAGQEVNFNIKVNSIKEKIIPDLTDEFIKDFTDYETIDEYKTETRLTLKSDFTWNKVIENSVVISYPKKNVEKYYNNMVKTYESYALQYGYTLESFISQSKGQSIEEFLTEAAEYAKSQVKQEMIMFSIARAENIEIDDDEYKEKSIEYAEKFGFDSVRDMEKAYTKETVKMNMLMEKVIDYVVGLSVETE
ncbi:MAG: trigger factor [Eubacteriales bacterium]|nr:trigger factor [Eubacteriales bacterium]